jgi:hypothetical protein
MKRRVRVKTRVRIPADPEKHRRRRRARLRRRLLRAAQWALLLAAASVTMWILIEVMGREPPP